MSPQVISALKNQNAKTFGLFEARIIKRDNELCAQVGEAIGAMATGLSVGVLF
jgi:hypothetical protein